MTQEPQVDQAEETRKLLDEAAKEQPPKAAPIEGEFKLTVRKLEMPVRPRGVLAE